jgi:hypothetical protein
MSIPMIRIHNISNNEIIDREMNDEELTQFKVQQAEAIKAKEEKETKTALRLLLLEKLGLTEEEAKLLLG